MKKRNWLSASSLSLLLLVLSSCAHVRIPDTEVCAVNGIMAAGASCDHTLSDQPRDMALNEFIDFLEPQPERQTPGGETLPARGAALCQSAEDWNKIKTALEQACYLPRKRCSYEMRESIAKIGATISKLSEGKKHEVQISDQR